MQRDLVRSCGSEKSVYDVDVWNSLPAVRNI